MILCNIILNHQPTLGVVQDGKVIDIAKSFAKIGVNMGKVTIENLLDGWEDSFLQLKSLVDRINEEKAVEFIEGNIQYLPPVRRPGTFRDFYAFETHVRNARKLRGLDIAPEWYQFPVFYFSNPNTISTTGAKVQFPMKSKKWDYELEVGAVLGKGGKNLSPEDAEKLIAGYLVMNDWSARDIQRAEMQCSLGPAKGKDFATSIGPWLVTPDELEDKRLNKGYDLKMTAKVNGEITSNGNWSTIHYSIAEMIARASEDAGVYAGELFGSGTVGNGCLLERGVDNTFWLHSGDIIELEIERLGVLTNQLS